LLAEKSELTTYEAKLYHDIERGGGGGLVRQLGGQKAAKRKLDESTDRLKELTKQLRKTMDTEERLQRQRRLMYEGHIESLISTEEFVEEGHIRCAPGEYVTVATRYKNNPRFREVANDIGKLVKRHTEGSWWVNFELRKKTMGFYVGGEGIFHLKYATDGEMTRTMLTVQQIQKEERHKEEILQQELQELENLKKGPSSLTYNRNPVICWYNVPLNQFVEREDIRYAKYELNFAAMVDDDRLRPQSRMKVNSVFPQCWGKEPFKWSWEPLWPTTHLPLGLEIDKRSGAVNGTPHFRGDAHTLVRCTDADGYFSTVHLKFVCKDLSGPLTEINPPL